MVKGSRSDLRRDSGQGLEQRKACLLQHYGSDTLDAANLIMPLVFFMAPTDPRMLAPSKKAALCRAASSTDTT